MAIVMIMSKLAPQILLFLVSLTYLLGSMGSNNGVGEPKIRCKVADRQALLKIKDNLQELEDGLLSSWGEEEEKRECCRWIGIRWAKKSGHVIALDLSLSTFERDGYTLLTGNLSSSLIDLEYLTYLDLSSIDFHENSIPSFIGSLSNLRYLNLSYTSLHGAIPPQFGNLSRLRSLDLSDGDSWSNAIISNLEWVSRLSSLRVLDLSSSNLSIADDWVRIVNNLPSLTTLRLSFCCLPDLARSSLSLVNSSKVLAVLDLSGNFLSSSIFQWLFNYNHSLVHIDLSYTHLKSHSLPEAFANMAALEYLDLGYDSIKGFIPKSFGNMASLTYLVLAGNELEGSIPQSLGNMTAITYLDLSSNRIEGFIPKSLGNMVALEYLSLANNRLKGSIPEAFGNMTRIEYVNLINNTLKGEIPKSIWGVCTLRVFRAHENNLSGQLVLAKLSSKCSHFSLEILDLRWNQITGPLPNFTLYPSLVELWLGSNRLDGISESVGHLPSLEILDISENYVKAVMSKTHFSKLFNLQYLDLSSNSQLAVNIHSHWIPPFQLATIYLGSCKLGPHFPKWLLSQKDYMELNISNSGISDSIPNRFWKLSSSFYTLDLSRNNFTGSIPEKKKVREAYVQFPAVMWSTSPEIDLSSNQLEGSIPPFLLNAARLNLFRNKFSVLNSLCNATTASLSLAFLDISYNQLSGEIPDCWSNMKNLQVLSWAGNSLKGKIPSSFGFLTRIQTLHLAENYLTAELPSSLKNCTKLMVLDVGNNELLGPIHAWIGNNLTDLVILSLRSNNFHGSISSQLCHLENLQLLDFSSNNLSSRIPRCLGSMKALREIGSNSSPVKYPYNYSFSIFSKFPLRYYIVKVLLVWKGEENEFINLGLLKNIDLSSNKLTGEIPREITELDGLVSLNLSRNNLSGRIPSEIGQLKSLDALDLSRNHLSGKIPSSLSQIDRLNTLDLSINNLSGKIPSGTQLQTRDAAAYMGNPELCGAPLLKKCPGDEEPTTSGGTEDAYDSEEEDVFITKGFYVSTSIGFIVGFWGVCGTLIFNKSSRYGYFRLLNNAGDWIYVTVVVHKAKLLRMIKG